MSGGLCPGVFCLGGFCPRTSSGEQDAPGVHRIPEDHNEPGEYNEP